MIKFLNTDIGGIEEGISLVLGKKEAKNIDSKTQEEEKGEMKQYLGLKEEL